jgi:hypothetical protein
MSESRRACEDAVWQVEGSVQHTEHVSEMWMDACDMERILLAKTGASSNSKCEISRKSAMH